MYITHPAAASHRPFGTGATHEPTMDATPSRSQGRVVPSS
jgi:hypothetical protein